MKSLDLPHILRMLIMLGYPIVALVNSLLSLGESALSIPFRVLVMIISIYCIYKTKNYSTKYLNQIMIFFFVIYFFRLVNDWRIDIDGTEKAIIYFLFVVCVPVIASASFGVGQHDDEQLAKLCGAYGFIFCIAVNLSKIMGLTFNKYEQYNMQADRLEFSGLNPISLGYTGYIAFCAALIVGYKYSDGIKRKLWIFASLAGLIVIIFSNSRSPIICVVLAILLIFGKKLDQWISIGAFGGLVSYVALNFLTNELSNISDRFTKGGNFAHDESREYLRSIAWDAFIKNPIFGAFHVDPTLGMGLYPHNIFYDTAMSLGLIGIVPLLIMIIQSLVKFCSFFYKDYPFLSVLLSGSFIQANASGTIWGYDFFFMALSLCLAAKKSNKNK